MHACCSPPKKHRRHHCNKNKQVNNLREIQALRRLSPNQHVITLEEVLYDQPTGRLALVFELMDANLYELIRGRRHYLNGQVRQKAARPPSNQPLQPGCCWQKRMQ